MSDAMTQDPRMGELLQKNGDQPLKAKTARLIVVETVVHQRPNEQPTQQPPSRFVRSLASDERPYIREMRVGETWQQLDSGWIGESGVECGMLTITNNEGRFTQVNPTPEQRAEATAKIVDLCYDADVEHCWIIYPGESMRAVPSSIKKLYLRCRQGTARVTIAAYPA